MQPNHVDHDAQDNKKEDIKIGKKKYIETRVLFFFFNSTRYVRIQILALVFFLLVCFCLCVFIKTTLAKWEMVRVKPKFNLNKQKQTNTNSGILFKKNLLYLKYICFYKCINMYPSILHLISRLSAF